MMKMKYLLPVLKNKLFYILILIVYIVNSAMAFNRTFNQDDLNAYYNGDVVSDTLVETVPLIEEVEQNELVNFAISNLGKPYGYGGKGPNRFDCSGFSSYVFKQLGLTLAASAHLQSKQGIAVNLKDLKPGDLLFFKWHGRKYISHVGIVTTVEEDNIYFVHSSTSRGVIISNLITNDYYNSQYAGARRLEESI